MGIVFREKQAWKKGWKKWAETGRVMKSNDTLAARKINRYVTVSFWSQEKMEKESLKTFVPCRGN